jgi:hypothetical protein
MFIRLSGLKLQVLAKLVKRAREACRKNSLPNLQLCPNGQKYLG